ncbi:MAG: hypothetical protein ACJ8AO_06595 [Gemmatimonadaceae bacterium]|jgi:hypothetical protein
MSSRVAIPVDADALASEEKSQFYRRVLETLTATGIDFLVGGAYAFTRYTQIDRKTKDFDLFVRAADVDPALAALEKTLGCRAEFTFRHWLGKAYCGRDFVDIIFSSGNGVATVDDIWFRYAVDHAVLGVPVRIIPPEELLWSKAFIMERERYDGADVIHIIHALAEKLDWERLLRRFGAYWRVLLSNMVLFGFVYPGERTRIPNWAMLELLNRLNRDLDHDSAVGKLCQGTIMSREQFLVDVERWGYADGRVERGEMTAEEVADWTAAIEKSKQGRRATDP